MSVKQNKWLDKEDIEEQESEKLPIKAIHKKITKKHDNLAKGLTEYKESLLQNKNKFLGWAKPKQLEKNLKTSKLLTSASNMNESKAEITIKKSFMTDHQNSIGSTVNALDYSDSLKTFAFAGFDKVLKLLKPNSETVKGYDMVSSIFFEGLPITNATFADSNNIFLTYFNKKFISLYDINSQKPLHFYKLFSTSFNPQKTIVNDNGLAVISNTKELAIFDINKKISTHKALQPDTIKDICSISNNDITVAYETDSIKIFDIRVSMNRPKSVIKKAVDIIAANNKYLATGNRNGIVQLFDIDNEYNLLKTYDNITTEISSISLNDNYMVFSSRWKNNSVRIADLRDLTIFPTWPNIKTRLNVVNKVLMNSNNQLVCGTAKGALDVYQLNLAQSK